jgi:hypothetical protein
MEFNIKINNKYHIIKNGTHLMFKDQNQHFIVTDINKKNILNRYSGYEFRIFNADTSDYLKNKIFTEEDIIFWLLAYNCELKHEIYY